jgi:hypothetical protein
MTEEPTEENGGDLEFRLDRASLYLEETFTDLKAGSVKRLTPVKPDGSPDKARKTVFIGHTSVLTPHGALPIQTEIPAKELSQALKRFPEAMSLALQALIAEAKKLNEEKQPPIIQTPESRIIVP